MENNIWMHDSSENVIPSNISLVPPSSPMAMQPGSQENQDMNKYVLFFSK